MLDLEMVDGKENSVVAGWFILLLYSWTQDGVSVLMALL